jgi:hypothetical protein
LLPGARFARKPQTGCRGSGARFARTARAAAATDCWLRCCFGRRASKCLHVYFNINKDKSLIKVQVQVEFVLYSLFSVSAFIMLLFLPLFLPFTAV